MKKHNKISTFLCGMLSAVLLMGCATAALAQSGDGAVSFGNINLKIGSKTVLEQGQTLTTDAGQKIPSSILYIDETGGGTTYLPLAAISRLLDIPVSWDGENSLVTLGRSGTPDITIGGDGTISAGEIQVGKQLGYYTELEPYWPTEDQISGVYAKDTTVSSPNGYAAAYQPYGEKIAISVTNNSDATVLYTVKSVSTLTTEKFPVIAVPAGQTVTRTFSAEEYPTYLYHTGLEISLGFEPIQAGLDHNVDVVIDAVCFKG